MYIYISLILITVNTYIFMASSICLSYGTALTSKLLRIRFNNLISHERVTITKLPNNSPSLLFPLKHASICHSKVVCAHKSSTSTPNPFEEKKNYNDGDDQNYKNGAILSRYCKVGVSNLVMACVIGLLIGGHFGNRMLNPKAAIAKYAPRSPKTAERQLPPRTPITAKGALQNLLYVNYEDLEKYRNLRDHVPDEVSMRYCSDLKSYAIKAGKVEDAEKLLREKYNKYKKNPSEPFYHVQMTLVELLIHQEKYDDAKTHLVSNIIPSDARFPLYKAIIYTMLGVSDEAIKWWNEYISVIDSSGMIPTDRPS